jgi:hypothetical protein
VRLAQPQTLQQAALGAPSLAHLLALGRQSAQHLKTIEPLLPIALRSALRPGPVIGMEWCLLVTGSSAAAKVRQLLPALLSHLKSQGAEITSIRLKVQTLHRT